jgi:uncharacterized protein (TIGR02444 family)
MPPETLLRRHFVVIVKGRENMKEGSMERPRLWDFSLSLYGQDGVSQACLSLQNESGVDVPVLLYAAWLGQFSIGLSPSDTAKIARSVAPWRQEVILPLRNLRTRLKSGPRPGPSERTETLRNAVKAAELSAERIELEALEAEGRQLRQPTDGSPLKNMIAVVRHYGGAEPDEQASSSIKTITAALETRP